MIRFEPAVRIHCWSNMITSALLNASMWSRLNDVCVVVDSIDDDQHRNPNWNGLGFSLTLSTEGKKPADLEALFKYLLRTIPEHYDVVCETDHVRVDWHSEQPATRLPKK